MKIYVIKAEDLLRLLRLEKNQIFPNINTFDKSENHDVSRARDDFPFGNENRKSGCWR